jgi:hypothetical protein
MIFVIRMGAALNTTSPGSLKLRSSATAYDRMSSAADFH